MEQNMEINFPDGVSSDSGFKRNVINTIDKQLLKEYSDERYRQYRSSLHNVNIQGEKELKKVLSLIISIVEEANSKFKPRVEENIVEDSEMEEYNIADLDVHIVLYRDINWNPEYSLPSTKELSELPDLLPNWSNPGYQYPITSIEFEIIPGPK